MINIPAKWNYIGCFVSIGAAVICAFAHDLTFLIINFIFAVWNWYIAEWKRGIENEQPKDRDGDKTKDED